MALLTVVSLTSAGVPVSPAAASGGGDTVPVDGDTVFVYVVNGSGSSMTVTASDSGLTGAGNPATVTANTIAAGTGELMALPRAAANPATGLVSLTYSSVTSVTVQAFRR